MYKERVVENKNLINSPYNRLSLGNVNLHKTSQNIETRQTYTKLKQKFVLKVFIDPSSNKKFVESSAAYALHLTKVRAIMLDNPKYYEITDDIISKVRLRGDEVMFITLPLKKEKLKLYYDSGNSFYIDNSAAYSIGLIEVEEFYQSSTIFYGPLSFKEIELLKSKYEIYYEQMNVILKEENIETTK